MTGKHGVFNFARVLSVYGPLLQVRRYLSGLSYQIGRSHSQLLFTREEHATLDFTDCRISFSLSPRSLLSFLFLSRSRTDL